MSSRKVKKVQFQKKGRKKASNGERRIARDENPRLLPMFQDQLCMGFVFQYVATNSFSGAFAVTFGNILDSWFVAGTATTAYQLFDFVRIKKVVVRSMGVAQPYSVGVQNPAPPMCTVGVEYYGLNVGNLGNGKQKVQTSIGYDTPAYVELAPDSESQVAQFQPTSTVTAFAIRAVDQNSQALAGTIVEVHVVLRNSSDVNPAAVSSARTGLQPGDLYFGGLDGNPTATTQMRSTFQRRA